MDPAISRLETTIKSLTKVNDFMDGGFDMALCLMESQEIREASTEEQRNELLSMVKEMANEDIELQARLAVLAEMQNKLKRGESVPMLTEYSATRLPTVKESRAKKAHPQVVKFEAALAGAAVVDEDGDLLMTQTEEEIPTTDGFSKQPLEPTDCFMNPECPSNCVFNKDSVDQMFKTKKGSITCPCCDLKLTKSSMKPCSASMVAKIKAAQRKMQGKNKSQGIRLD